MILDSHVYCFVSPDQPAGHSSAEAHLREVQVFHALHHQPAWRTRDRATSDAGRLLDPTDDEPLRVDAGVAFRVDRTHQAMLDHVGAPNLLWGTDMPFQNRFCAHRQSRRWIETCGLLDGSELDDVMGRTAARLLGIAPTRAAG
jgi:hypothetical protein